MTDKYVEEAPYHPGYEDAIPEPQKPSVLVGTPMYGGLCNGVYALSMMKMVGTFTNAGVPFQYTHLMNESLITRGRNTIADQFLKSDCTHLMFIDADIEFEAYDILKMLGADKDIICGIYPKKEINWKQVTGAVQAGVPPEELTNYTGAFVVNLIGDAESATGDINSPMQIANGGTGFMLIKRAVFEKLAQTVPEYHNDVFSSVEDHTQIQVIKEFFTTSIDETSKRLLSEDYYFCKIAREQGFTVWAAPWARLTHCGTYNFNGNLPTA